MGVIHVFTDKGRKGIMGHSSMSTFSRSALPPYLLYAASSNLNDFPNDPFGFYGAVSERYVRWRSENILWKYSLSHAAETCGNPGLPSCKQRHPPPGWSGSHAAGFPPQRNFVKGVLEKISLSVFGENKFKSDNTLAIFLSV